MFKNADCTLYKYDKDTGGYIRHFIEGVYWHGSKDGSVSKSGLSAADSTTVFIYQHYPVPESPTKDILVKGCCEFEFDNTSPQTVSVSLKKLRGEEDFVTVIKIDDCWYGGLPHLEISAK